MIVTESDQRAAVQAAARKWLGTPYHHAADIPGVGIDCGMLIVRVFVDTRLVAPFDPRPYPPDFFLHRSDERYLGWVFDRAKEVSEPTPGDVVVFRHGRTFSHGGIVLPERGQGLRIIHASAKAARCLEEDLAGSPYENHPRRFFNPWAK